MQPGLPRAPPASGPPPRGSESARPAAGPCGQACCTFLTNTLPPFPQQGFGNIDGEYWLGLENIYWLTNQGNYKLLVTMEDWSGRKVFAEYASFRLEPESEYYKLRLGRYHGNAGDSFTWHNGKQFTTLDRDHDVYTGRTPWSHTQAEGREGNQSLSPGLRGPAACPQGPVPHPLPTDPLCTAWSERHLTKRDKERGRQMMPSRANLSAVASPLCRRHQLSGCVSCPHVVWVIRPGHNAGPPPTSHVSVGMLLNLPGPQFPPLELRTTPALQWGEKVRENVSEGLCLGLGNSQGSSQCAVFTTAAIARTGNAGDSEKPCGRGAGACPRSHASHPGLY